MEDKRLTGHLVKQSIKVKFANQLECAHSILNKSISIMDYGESIQYETESFARLLIATLHTKAFTTLHALITLCEESFDKDALGLVRNLMEIDFIIAYILKNDPEEMTKYYLYQEEIKKDVYLKAKITHLGEENTENLEKLIEERRNQIPEENKRYLDKKTNPFWKITFSDMAKNIGKELEYEILYRYLCEYVHSASLGLKSYMGECEGDRLKIKPGRNDEKILEALRFGCRYYLEIFKSWSIFAMLNKEGEIRLLEAKILKTFVSE